MVKPLLLPLPLKFKVRGRDTGISPQSYGLILPHGCCKSNVSEKEEKSSKTDEKSVFSAEKPGIKNKKQKIVNTNSFR